MAGHRLGQIDVGARRQGLPAIKTGQIHRCYYAAKPVFEGSIMAATDPPACEFGQPVIALLLPVGTAPALAATGMIGQKQA